MSRLFDQMTDMEIRQYYAAVEEYREQLVGEGLGREEVAERLNEYRSQLRGELASRIERRGGQGSTPRRPSSPLERYTSLYANIQDSPERKREKSFLETLFTSWDD